MRKGGGMSYLELVGFYEAVREQLKDSPEDLKLLLLKNELEEWLFDKRRCEPSQDDKQSG